MQPTSNHPSSSARAQRFQPSVPEDSAVSAPGRWTQLLFSHLQAQSLMSPNLHAHTHKFRERWHSSYTEKASEDCCAFSSTHMPVLTQNISTRQPSPPLQLTRIDVNYRKHTCCHSLDSKAHKHSWIPRVSHTPSAHLVPQPGYLDTILIPTPWVSSLPASPAFTLLAKRCR